MGPVCSGLARGAKPVAIREKWRTRIVADSRPSILARVVAIETALVSASRRFWRVTFASPDITLRTGVRDLHSVASLAPHIKPVRVHGSPDVDRRIYLRVMP